MFGASADLHSTAPRLLAPSVAVGVSFVPRSTVRSPTYANAFALQTGSLEGCPIRIGDERLSLRPCARMQIGRLQGKSSGFVGARLEADLWLALLAAVRARMNLVGPMHAELDLSLGTSFHRPAFFVGDTQVFEVPAIVGSASGGLGMHF